MNSVLGFMSRDGVHVDKQRPGGVLRAPTLTLDPGNYPALDRHVCAMQDLLADKTETPLIASYGFEKINISHLQTLQTLLQTIRSNNRITPENISAIRRSLTGKSIALANGKTLRILFVAGEGTIMRTAGPNGLIVNHSDDFFEVNHKVGAPAVHGDQDVRGTPVRQILKGLGPWLFRHEAPDGFNRKSPLFLLNLWIPMQQITQPLVLMDERSWNRKEHQLRYALPVESFLERDDDRKLNDIWTALYHPDQKWYFSSGMDSHHAYIFNTLSNPHGATHLPGEDRAEQLYLALKAASEGKSVPPVNIPLHPQCTAPLREAITQMECLLEKTASDSEWLQRAKAAMDRVVRKSIEMRMVCWVS